MIKRKGSMIFDIILGLAAFLFILGLIMPSVINWRFTSDFRNFIKKTDNFIQLAVIDPYKGYVSANNSYCAPDYINSFQDITAYRIVKCTGIENNVDFFINDANTTNETNPSKSYIKDLKQWTNKNSNRDSGCRIYFSQGDDTSKYNVFFDCSSLRKPGIADSEILTYFKEKYPVYLIGYDINALSIDKNYIPIGGEIGTDNDGKLLLNFQK